MSQLTHLSDVAGLDVAISESRARPVLLFKHSLTCGISCEALDELRAHIDGGSGGVGYRLITIQSHRNVSDEVALRFNVRHQSPQVILVRDGVAVWNGSHFRITARQLDQVIGDLVN